MIFLSHILSSILILKVLHLINPSEFPVNSYSAILSIFFAILPDIDFFMSDKLHSHRKTMFHAPLSFVIVFLAGLLVNYLFGLFPFWILYLFIAQAVFHLASDIITARSCGIYVWYPFSEKEYTLFPLEKSYGDFHPMKIASKEYRGFWKYYLKNKIMLGFELLVIVLGIISVFV